MSDERWKIKVVTKKSSSLTHPHPSKMMRANRGEKNYGYIKGIPGRHRVVSAGRCGAVCVFDRTRNCKTSAFRGRRQGDNNRIALSGLVSRSSAGDLAEAPRDDGANVDSVPNALLFGFRLFEFDKNRCRFFLGYTTTSQSRNAPIHKSAYRYRKPSGPTAP